MPILKRTMFREYDLRGRESDDELNDNSMYYIGRGFGTFLKKRGINQVVVGNDARGTSESFHDNVIKALVECGLEVTDIGTVTTPMSYWAQYHLKIKGLVMVTASHNPAGWNGVKMGADYSSTLLSDEMKEVYDIIFKDEFIDGTGLVKKEDIKEEYIKDLLSRAKITKKFKILINTANGTAGLFAPELLRRTGCEVIEHFTNIDPTYPNYTPNPDGTAMMEDTGKKTIENKCDFGFAFDGDGDRLGMVDEKGNTIFAPGCFESTSLESKIIYLSGQIVFPFSSTIPSLSPSPSNAKPKSHLFSIVFFPVSSIIAVPSGFGV